MSHRLAVAPTRALALALAEVRAFLATPGNEVGGTLHVALDDGNLGDDTLAFCARYASEENDPDGAHIARLLLTFTEDEREWLYQHRRA